MTTMNDTGAGGTCTNPTDVAANTDDFNSTNFPNVCIGRNITSYPQVVTAFESCCGVSPLIKISDGCYSYCNVAAVNQSNWLKCFQSQPGVGSGILGADYSCLTDTQANITTVALTSSPTPDSSTVTTINTIGPTATAKSSGSPTTTSASPSSTKKSQAGHAVGFSKGALVVVAMALVGTFLA